MSQNERPAPPARPAHVVAPTAAPTTAPHPPQPQSNRPPRPAGHRRRAVLAIALLLVLGAGRLATTVVPAMAAATDADANRSTTQATPAPDPASSRTEQASSKDLTPEQQQAAKNELTAGKAVVLGIVEGVTEYLPISSTGHLLVTERILDVGQDDLTKDATDTYTIAIQLGAILAVLVLYFGRIRRMAEGLIGRDPEGRRTLVAVVVAFVPAALAGVLGEHFIKEHLLAVAPVVVTWIVGAIAIFVFSRRYDEDTPGSGIDAITLRQAVIVGAAQVLALWPGTSRSMVTIIAAMLVGLTLGAAVEFSFLLGLLTLSAATVYSLAKDGGQLVDTFGWVNPLIGLVVAFVSAMVAVRWMVSYLQRHNLNVFAWYRLGVAALTIILLATSAI